MAENQTKIIATDTVGASALTQYKLVKTAGALVVSAAATDDCIGIIENGYDASATNARVCIFGKTKAIAHGAISKYAALVPAAAGRVDAHDGTPANPIIGIALEAATAQDDEIEIALGVTLLAGPAA